MPQTLSLVTNYMVIVMRKLVYGAGINDADYVVQPTINGKQVACPFYRAWKGMLQRCYDSKYQAKYPAYIGCSVCDEWKTFSNFRRWMEPQDWQGKELDKDLLFIGNKIYSPDACVFVNSTTNNFTTDHGADRGEWPLGVSFHKRDGKLEARCRNPFTAKKESLGYYTCQTQAHEAWRKRKHELACQLAGLQTDKRVADALRNRYA